MRTWLAFTGFFLLVSILSQVNGGKLLISGSEKPPTLSKAIQLLQLDTIKQLKKIIKDKEYENLALEKRIMIVEEEKKENLNQSEQQKTQIKEDLESKILGLEIEMTQIKEELKKKLYEAQTKCQEEKDALDQEHTEALIKLKNVLLEKQGLVEYMSDIILHSHTIMEEREKLIETQEIAIKEINKKSKTYKKITAKQLAANEKALQTISLQEENIDLLKSSLTTAQQLSKLSTNDLDNISVAPFMVELMESYNKQTNMVENLRIVLEQDKEIETHISEILSEIANTSLTTNLLNSNWDTIEQQAKMIQMQSKSISLLRPLLGSNPNKMDILWFNKAEDGTILEASSCGCLPKPTQPTSLVPSRIEYLCDGEGNRSYSLECESGVCGTEKFPTCEETVLWENKTLLWDNCQEVNFDGVLHLCGEGSMEERKTKTIGVGLMTEVVKTPCGDCGDLSTALDWQPWASCVNENGNADRPDMQCRRRGNTKIGFQEEEKAAECSFKLLGCWKDTGNRAIATLEGTDSRLSGDYGTRQNAVEICFQVAKSKGYPAFAVQDGGWCAGSSTALDTYKKYGKTTECNDGKGGSWANDVYQVTCDATDVDTWGKRKNVFGDDQCQNIGGKGALSISACKMECDRKLGCNAINVRPDGNDCVLRKCPFPIPEPSSIVWSSYESYFKQGLFTSARSSSVYGSSDNWGPQFVIDSKMSAETTKLFISTWEDYPWLEIKFRVPTLVYKIIIANRKDCCGNRLKNVEIRAGMKSVPAGTANQMLNINNVCGVYQGPGISGSDINIDCNEPILAKYLTIQLKDQNSILQINEVNALEVKDQ